MKSQERHRLEKNALADWIGQTLSQLKPYLTPILVLLLVVTVVFGGWSLWNQHSTSSSGALWAQLYAALSSQSVEKLESLATAHPRSDVAQWATLVAADERLAAGCQALFMDPASAIQELNKAKKGYQTVLDESRLADLQERAYYGLGRTYEALAGTRQSEGLDPALKAYESLLQNEQWKNGPFGQLARERVSAIKSMDVKRFYDKFASYERKSPFLNEPGTPGKRPDFDAKTLPDAGPQPQVPPATDLKLQGKTPEKPAPAKTEPAKTEPAKTEPAKTEPAKQDPKNPAAKTK